MMGESTLLFKLSVINMPVGFKISSKPKLARKSTKITVPDVAVRRAKVQFTGARLKPMAVIQHRL